MKIPVAKLLCVCVVVGVCGCGETEEPDIGGAIDKSAFMQQAQVDKKKKKATNVKSVFVYSSVGLRDPFRSYLADLAAVTSEEKPRPLQVTEKFELDQYRLTGLVTGTSQPKAMVEDPEGMGHTLRVGSRLGRNGGRVTRISAKGVVVVEETINPLGQKVRVPITLKLPKDPNAFNIKLQ